MNGIGLEYIVDLLTINYKDVAEELGISPKTINDWVKLRSHVPNKRLKELSDFFEIDPALINNELTEVQKLKLKIKFKEKVNEMLDGKEYNGIRNWRTLIQASKQFKYSDSSELENLERELFLLERIESLNTQLKKFTTDLSNGQEHDYEKEIVKYHRYISNFISLMAMKEGKKAAIINDLVYFLMEFYDVDQTKWVEKNALIDSSYHYEFFSELNNILKKYNFR
ncbi:Helix-turn-helix [Paenibacillus sp. yr247]|uniref:helix-turn-helix domain-containing protein n=1 Tax=Paenibacillus sp. yr247 TaxID=1761880 RepID=UPI00087FC5B7|nr:helix-turn-helix transcriptional regulator [Paenibacillus sp. yr247]SDN34064.1 Helix-turn-helix [Paenibacillus sp. yr247]